MRKLSALVAASLLCVTTAHAEPFSTMGIGALTCAQFFERYRSDPAIEDRFFDWASTMPLKRRSANIAT
jgi:hypothetical protein